MRSDKELKDFLSTNQESIGNSWLRLILETYPSETSAFLKKKQDRFANPVGHAASEMVEGVISALVEEAGIEELGLAMRPLVQIRAVQGSEPSVALEVVFLLKKAVLESVGRELAATSKGLGLLLKLHVLVDDLVKIGFDIYCECRDRLQEVRIDELKRNLYMLMKDKGALNIDGQARGN